MIRFFTNRRGFESGISPVLLLILISLSFAAGTNEIFAHAKLLSSKPADGESLRQAPEKIELIFSTRLQSPEVSSIIVTDQNGRRVDDNDLSLSEDGKKILVGLQALNSGSYSVEWKTVSADDHLIKGSFGFDVQISKDPYAANLVPTPNANSAENNETKELIKLKNEIESHDSPTKPAQSLFRWLAYLSMTILFGGFVFKLFVLKPAFAQTKNLIDADYNSGKRLGFIRFILLNRFGLILLAISAFANLVLQTSSMFEIGVGQALNLSQILTVFTETAFGSAWLLQAAAVIALGFIVFFLGRRLKDQDFSGNDSQLLWIGAAVCTLLFISTGLSGHARAASDEYSFALLSDWLHLLAVGCWLGGLFHLVFTLRKSASQMPVAQRGEFVSRAITNFNPLAVISVIVLVLTGFYNSWINVRSFPALWNTTYGTVLLVKIILFLPMLALGGFNSYVVRPRLEKSSEEENGLYRLVLIETIIGSIVLLLTAVIAFLPPGGIN